MVRLCLAANFPSLAIAIVRVTADNHRMHRSGGGQFSCLLASLSPPPGDAYRYPTESRTFAAFLAPCGAQPTHDRYRFTPTPD
ncbi:hypothetical protein [Rubripirellula obstinata]|uniref:hypothetical protein n=1 Tax=Rubripirellula obstinata TaxID=406547 RepID=UPI001390137E|nr:hypothetical protein [Rubripirellula obstinata]